MTTMLVPLILVVVKKVVRTPLSIVTITMHVPKILVMRKLAVVMIV
jgi:hypothetical protein